MTRHLARLDATLASRVLAPGRPRILIYGAPAERRASLARPLRQRGWEIVEAGSMPEAIEAIERGGFEVALIDFRPTGEERADDLSILLHLHVTRVDSLHLALVEEESRETFASIGAFSQVLFLDREISAERLWQTLTEQGVAQPDPPAERAPVVACG